MTSKQRAALVKIQLLGGLSENMLTVLNHQHGNYKPICRGYWPKNELPIFRALARLGLLKLKLVRPNCKKLHHDDGDPCCQTRLTALGKKIRDNNR